MYSIVFGDDKDIKDVFVKEDDDDDEPSAKVLSLEQHKHLMYSKA